MLKKKQLAAFLALVAFVGAAPSAHAVVTDSANGGDLIITEWGTADDDWNDDTMSVGYVNAISGLTVGGSTTLVDLTTSGNTTLGDSNDVTTVNGYLNVNNTATLTGNVNLGDSSSDVIDLNGTLTSGTSTVNGTVVSSGTALGTDGNSTVTGTTISGDTGTIATGTTSALLQTQFNHTNGDGQASSATYTATTNGMGVNGTTGTASFGTSVTTMTYTDATSDAVANGTWSTATTVTTGTTISGTTGAITMTGADADIALTGGDITIDGSSVVTEYELLDTVEDYEAQISDEAAIARTAELGLTTRLDAVDDLISEDSDGKIHIGNNSLIVYENTVTDQEELSASNGTSAIDINVVGGSDLLVDGSSVVTEADLTTGLVEGSTLDAAVVSESERDADLLQVAEDIEDAVGIEAARATGVEGALDTRLLGVESSVGTLTTNVGTLTTNVGTLTTNVGTLTTDVNALDTRVDSIESNFTDGGFSITNASAFSTVGGVTTYQSLNFATSETAATISATNSNGVAVAVNVVGSDLTLNGVSVVTEAEIADGGTLDAAVVSEGELLDATETLDDAIADEITRASGVEDALDTRLANAESDIGTLTTSVGTLTTEVGALDTRIDTLEGAATDGVWSITHEGDESLTFETGATTTITAKDYYGNDADIEIAGTSDLIVQGSSVVTEAEIADGGTLDAAVVSEDELLDATEVLEDALAAETTRATGVEGALDTRLTTAETNIGTLTADVGTLTTDVGTLDTRIDTLEGAATDGSWGITNDGDESLTFETGAITTITAKDYYGNDADIEIAGDSDLIVQGSSVVTEDELDTLISEDSDGKIHIGNNSLIVYENTVTDQEELSASNGTSAIDINVVGGSDLLVDGSSVVTEADLTTGLVEGSTLDAAVASEAELNSAISAVSTSITSSFADGEFSITNAGMGAESLTLTTGETNATISATNAAGTAVDIKIGDGSDLIVGNSSVVTEAEIADGGSLDAAVVSEAELSSTLSNYVTTTALDTALADYTTTAELEANYSTTTEMNAAIASAVSGATSDGNLTITNAANTATVNGVTTYESLSLSTGETTAKIAATNAYGDAVAVDIVGTDLTLNGVSVATDTEVAAAVLTETNARIAADTAEASARAAADTVLTNAIAQEVTDRTAAVSAEATTRAAADTVLTNSINQEVADRAAADTVLRNSIIAETTARASADAALDSRLDKVEAFAQYTSGELKKLRHGIAMAAAMQTPIIEAGKKNAARISAAYFDDEVGMAFGYARRINGSIQVSADAATSDDFEEATARASVNYSW